MTVPAIFYDLETTDTEPVGQILNYAFAEVDSNFELGESLSENIRISRLQLPRAGAILANRVDVQKHQKETALSEPEAMKRIQDFIWKIIRKNKGNKVALIGYNSSRFDLPFLRTSFMRNGLNPYFEGKLIYRDLLFAARRLAVSRSDFPRSPAAEREGEGRLSLTLENLNRRLGNLKGKQKHESLDDVRLTAALARSFKERFDLDVRDFDPYEARELHGTKAGLVFESLEPNYDLTSNDPVLRIPITLLDSDYRQALWIDLNHFKETRDQTAIRWKNTNTHSLLTDKTQIHDEDILTLSKEAHRVLGKIRLPTYFQKTRCDIEQHIYRLDFDAMDNLQARIWSGDGVPLTDRDQKTIYTRYKLATYEYGTSQDQKVDELLKKYALYRYGGELLLSKSDETQGTREPLWHPTYGELLNEITEREKDANGEDLKLLASLKAFYESSDIVRVAGAELKGKSDAQRRTIPFNRPEILVIRMVTEIVARTS